MTSMFHSIDFVKIDDVIKIDNLGKQNNCYQSQTEITCLCRRGIPCVKSGIFLILLNLGA